MSSDDEDTLPPHTVRFIPPNISSGPITPINAPINGWTNESIETLNRWRDNLNKLSFIYDVVGMKYIQRNDKYLIIIAICSGLIGLLGTMSASLLVPNNTDQNTIIQTNSSNISSNDSSAPYYWVVFGINIISALLGSISALLSYIIKLKDWQNKIKLIFEAIKNIDTLYVVINTQSLLPCELREDGAAFITKTNIELSRVLQSCPNIDPDDYEMANLKYESQTGIRVLLGGV